MKLFVDRGDCMEMCEEEGVEMVLRGAGEEEVGGEYAPCGFDQTFSKFDAWFESMRGDGGRKERNPKKSAEEGRNDINTRKFFAEGKAKKEPFFSKGFFRINL